MRIGLMVWKGSRPRLAAPGQNLVRAVPGCRHPPGGDSSNFRRIQGFELSVEGAEAKPAEITHGRVRKAWAAESRISPVPALNGTGKIAPDVLPGAEPESEVTVR